MADYVERFADKQEEKLVRKIADVYGQAGTEVEKKLRGFLKKHRAKSEMLSKQVADGKISKEDYQAWLRGQVFQGEQWKRLLQDVTKTYYNTDTIASSMLWDTEKVVFVEADNYTAYDIERNAWAAVSFNIYDTKTVEKLFKDDPQLLPEWRIDQKKDYAWNYQRAQNAVLQGIIQGESVRDIGKRLSQDLAISNASKMRMFARTAVTGAQNAGRMARWEEAVSKGVNVRKQWMASLDSRTRDTHRELDGQVQDIDKHFKVGTKEILFPGDATAEPALVYNCRCTLKAVYPEYESQDVERIAYRINPKTGKRESYYVGNVTYREWQAGKIAANTNTNTSTKKVQQPVPTAIYSNHGKAIQQILAGMHVDKKSISRHATALTDDAIFDRLGGGDLTRGSCSSLALAYAGNKAGYDVLDFRGGDSQRVFSRNSIIEKIASLDGVDGISIAEYSDFAGAKQLLKEVKEGKQYYFASGQHAAIIQRLNENMLVYLEMQSPYSNGWQVLDRDALKNRFGCKSSHTFHGYKYKGESFLIDVEKLGRNPEFIAILEYINTDEADQQKGRRGNVK